MLTYLEIARHFGVKWVVWENVPGVLSSAGGRDFGAFLGALGELGYGWAYRVLDAQWFGVAQRRRRVFVVGCLGDQAAAAKVLFESESVCRNPAPSREKGKGSTSVAGTLAANGGGLNRPAGNCNEVDFCVPVVTMAHGQANAEIREDSRSPTLTCIHEAPIVAQPMQVRRLTPVECERLQGFPDGYTMIPWKKKPAEDCPDGPRYKALGNSMAVPVMRWIGERIDKNNQISLF